MHDPFADIQRAAERQHAEELAMKQLSEARARLVLRKDAPCVFLATLALRLSPKIDWEIPTAETDGRSLFLNPGWFNSLTDAERIGIVAHEVLHPAMQHHTRRSAREPRRWNIAADAAINPIIAQAGLSLPEHGIFPGHGAYADLPPDLSAEEYYALLPDEPSDGDGDDPGGCGSVRDGGDDPAGIAAAEAEAAIAVAQAANEARRRGTLPGGLERLISEITDPHVDWRSMLREFVSRYARDDYSWSRPNRRYIASGMYLPSLHSDSMGDVVALVDTSASISPEDLRMFISEICGILDAYDCTMHVVYHDCAVCHVQEWRSTDGPLVAEPKGGGGTDHRPCWTWIDDHAPDAACIVALTDGDSEFGDGPSAPIIWCLQNEIVEPPFGSIARLRG